MQLGWLERGQVGEELFLTTRELTFQINKVGLCEIEAVKERQALGQSSKYCELSLEWVLSDEEVKGSILFSISSL